MISETAARRITESPNIDAQPLRKGLAKLTKMQKAQSIQPYGNPGRTLA